MSSGFHGKTIPKLSQCLGWICTVQIYIHRILWKIKLNCKLNAICKRTILWHSRNWSGAKTTHLDKLMKNEILNRHFGECTLIASQQYLNWNSFAFQIDQKYHWMCGYSGGALNSIRNIIFCAIWRDSFHFGYFRAAAHSNQSKRARMANLQWIIFN